MGSRRQGKAAEDEAAAVGTTYTPEALAAARRNEERKLVREGIELWRAKKEESLRQRQHEQLELRRMLANYWPWGRPGGGAPCTSALRKRNVPLEPLTEDELMAYQSARGSLNSYPLDQSWRFKSTSDPQRYSRAQAYDTAYRETYEPCSNFQPTSLGSMRKRYNDESDGFEYHRSNDYNHTNELGGGVELVPLMQASSGRSSPCKQQTRSSIKRHVAANDATRHGYMIDSWRAFNAADRGYVADLADQIRRKQERAMVEHQLESEGSRRHFDTWRKLWGRPGHGAPIDQARRRNNLHDILYRSAAAAAATATAAI